MSETENSPASEFKPICFIMMPFTTPAGYPAAHFDNVYKYMLQPACEQAGFFPRRTDTTEETSLIHLDILRDLLEAPMALCDLSTRNPNVTFELGMRQAFDKPVVLVQELGTPKMFDINPLRIIDYRKERIYEQVIEDRERIANSLKATFDAAKSETSVNSIVRLLSIGKAIQPNVSPPTPQEAQFQALLASFGDVQEGIRTLLANQQREKRISRAAVAHRIMPVDEVAVWICARLPSASRQMAEEAIVAAIDKLKLDASQLAHEVREGRVYINISDSNPLTFSLERLHSGGKFGL